MDLSIVPTPPREPSERARRLLFKAQPGDFVFLIVGSVFMAVGLPMMTVFCWGLWVDAAIVLASVRVEGRVVDTRPNHNVSINGVHPTTIRFAYTIDDRGYVGETDVLDSVITEAASPGTPIEVEVAAARPDWARVAGETSSTFGWFGLFTLIFPAVGGVMLLAALRAKRRRVRAFTRGVPAEGRIATRELNRFVRINREHPTQVVYEFEAGGRRYTGTVSTMAVELLDGLDQGASVAVLHDRDDPSISTLYIS